ncbi:class I SAM-dependent methyltransferase [Spongisporangium articulatum]|uniref:Class I SAM-dependent methyltransferase n=1 Tax=Spongisporangium articulatum TaxID=3362603 RepID=A0ABW8AIE7_9ACTN
MVVSRTQRWERQRTSFGADATGYDRHRPGWPATTAAWLTGTEPGGPFAGRALDVLDVGAGTGKLTRTLVDAGHRVTALDPSGAMLAVLREREPRAHVVRAGAEAIPLPDGSVDAVTVAQAWHWVDAGRAAAEVARVLRPGGVFGLGWHARNESAAWTRELRTLVGEPTLGNGKSIHEQRSDPVVPGPFGPMITHRFGIDLALTPAGLGALAASWSYVSIRADRDDVVAQVEALGRRVAGAAGTLRLPYDTWCHRVIRLP